MYFLRNDRVWYYDRLIILEIEYSCLITDLIYISIVVIAMYAITIT